MRGRRALADEDDARAAHAPEHEVLRAGVDGDGLLRERPAAADGPERGVGRAGLALDLRVRGRLRAAGEDEHRREQRERDAEQQDVDQRVDAGTR